VERTPGPATDFSNPLDEGLRFARAAAEVAAEGQEDGGGGHIHTCERAR
jgi:hypothetical protein